MNILVDGKGTSIKMLTFEAAQRLVLRWIDAWNARDLAAILSMYSDDFSMASPYIVTLTGEASGTLSGKDAVGAYWRRALERFADLQFELQEFFVGVDSIVMIYRSNHSGLVAEVFAMDGDGLIRAASAHYQHPIA